MTLRTKLVISFTVLLLVVIAIVGVVASSSVESILVGQIDNTLTGLADRGPHPGGGPPPAPETDDPFLNPIAEIVVAPDGSVVFARPSGFADDPDPLPDISGLGPETGFVYLGSEDGEMDYRALVTDTGEGARVILAAPLDQVATAQSELITKLVVGGVLVLLLGAAATWWTVSRAMRPVGEMVETAEAIAAGDLTRRVVGPDPNTELGRLGKSLNEMLAHIEESVQSEKSAQDRLRQFVADASHELRTPITAISGYAELHRRGGLATREEEERAWARIESEGKRMGSLVEDMLTLARLGRTTPLHLSDVDLAEVASNAADDHRVIDPERPIEVTGPSSLVVEADAERIHQVITNLLNNARVHTPPWTQVKIALSEDDDTVLIQVSDNGTGFPPESVDHVFDRFYRADRSRSRRTGGSGLGLAIVEAIVAAHSGTVLAANGDDGGAMVTITLPRRQPGTS